MSNLPELFYTVPECAEILRISKRRAYQIVKIKGFPVCRIGKKILINKNGLEKWLTERQFI